MLDKDASQPIQHFVVSPVLPSPLPYLSGPKEHLAAYDAFKRIFYSYPFFWVIRTARTLEPLRASIEDERSRVLLIGKDRLDVMVGPRSPMLILDAFVVEPLSYSGVRHVLLTAHPEDSAHDCNLVGRPVHKRHSIRRHAFTLAHLEYVARLTI
jgi:hypothetical protein